MNNSDGGTISDLRGYIFEQMRALRDAPPAQLADALAKAKGMAELAQVGINSAKVEVDHQRVTGSAGSGFIPDASKSSNKRLIEQRPGVTVTQHICK